MPSIRLPDGSLRAFDKPVTVAEVAASNGLDLQQTRDLIAQGLFGEQPLPLGRSSSVT